MVNRIVGIKRRQCKASGEFVLSASRLLETRFHCIDHKPFECPSGCSCCVGRSSRQDCPIDPLFKFRAINRVVDQEGGICRLEQALDVAL